jgi:MoxR-like ATPase
VSSPPDIAGVGERARAVLDAVERAVVGKRDVLELVLIALLADGHVLIEDVPGLGKTLIARSFARACGLGFGRIQCTPDLLPSDITGSTIYDARNAELRFVPGPVFTHLLLADEVNRATPKTQAALLEAMEERQVTTDQGTRPLERPFVVLATQNPIEFEGTYPLPEAQVDRFLLRLSVGYPHPDDEWGLLERRLARGADEAPVETVLGAGELIAMQAAVEAVHVSERIGRYAVELVRATREDPDVSVGASPRGTLALAKLGRACAVLDGRDFVTPDDVQAVAVPALSHRLVLRPESWVRELRGEEVVRRCLEHVGAPPVAEDEP